MEMGRKLTTGEALGIADVLKEGIRSPSTGEYVAWAIRELVKQNELLKEACEAVVDYDNGGNEYNDMVNKARKALQETLP